MGPVCGENIRFFASRVAKLYVCDLFQRLCQETRRGRSASHIWRDLNYPVGSFEAVQLWDLGDHLEDRDFTRLVELCVLMLKPKGMLMLIAMGEQADPTFSMRSGHWRSLPASCAGSTGPGSSASSSPQPRIDRHAEPIQAHQIVHLPERAQGIPVSAPLTCLAQPHKRRSALTNKHLVLFFLMLFPFCLSAAGVRRTQMKGRRPTRPGARSVTARTGSPRASQRVRPPSMTRRGKKRPPWRRSKRWSPREERKCPPSRTSSPPKKSRPYPPT